MWSDALRGFGSVRFHFSGKHGHSVPNMTFLEEDAQFCTLQKLNNTSIYIFLAKIQCFQNTVLLEEEFQHGHVWGRVL